MYGGRDKNKVADRLAKHGLELQTDLYWVEDHPDFVSEHIAHDASFYQ